MIMFDACKTQSIEIGQSEYKSTQRWLPVIILDHDCIVSSTHEYSL